MATGHFGEALRRHRLGAKKTLKDIADLLGVSVPYVSDVELGRRQPFSSGDISRVAEFLGCDANLDRLLTLAVQDRGEITFNPRNDETRELLVALNRQIQNLDEESVKKIKAVLDSQRKR